MTDKILKDEIIDTSIPTDLCHIMGKYGSDKGSSYPNKSWHNYTTIYHKLFETIRYDKLKIFELGLGTNNPNIPSNMGVNGVPLASVRGWEEYFSNSEISGADIDVDILKNEGRIKTFYCDQLNHTVIANMWNSIGKVDIIVEDGLHEFHANVCFFENSVNQFNKYYITEDIVNDNYDKFLNIINGKWKVIYPDLSFQLIKVNSEKNKVDNTMLIIKRN